MSCDLYDACRDQGCNFNPENCPRVCDLRKGIDKRPDDFNKLDDVAKFALLQSRLRDHPGGPIPAAWVEWLLQYVRPPRSGPGVIVTTNPERESGWTRKNFKDK